MIQKIITKFKKSEGFLSYKTLFTTTMFIIVGIIILLVSIN